VPELPDVVVYIERLDDRLAGRTLERIRLLNPFVLRSVSPPIASAEGRKVRRLRRLGKRIVFELEGALFIVLHLMIAGRLRWLARDKKPPGRISLAAFEFDDGTLVLTEAGTKRRASIHLVEGEAALAAMEPGGLEVLDARLEDFAARLKADRHTLKTRSPIRICSAVSATRTRTRSCTARSSRLSRRPLRCRTRM
jgi:formamidopyrimidine-DNA glycosylase